jgi:hypothetical protein
MAISMSDLRKHFLNRAAAEDEHKDVSQAMADEHSAMQKASGKVADSHHGRMRDLHQHNAKTHEQSAKEWRDAAEKCTKADGSDDLSKATSDLLRRLEIIEGTIQPTRVNAVVPTAPGIRSVPRADSVMYQNVQTCRSLSKS